MAHFIYDRDWWICLSSCKLHAHGVSILGAYEKSVLRNIIVRSATWVSQHDGNLTERSACEGERYWSQVPSTGPIAQFDDGEWWDAHR